MSPDKKKKLYILIKKLDNLDNKLIRLIKLRTNIVKNVLKLKTHKYQIVDKKRNHVNGEVVLKIYKGNITILSRRSKNKAYSLKKVSFEENKTFKKSKIEKFIKFHSKQLHKQ